MDLPEQFADKDLFFFEDGSQPHAVGGLRGADLAARLRRVGSALQAVGAAQQRVLLVLPQGQAYIEALLGCLHANLAAVPLPHHADPARLAAAIVRIGGNAGAICVLTDAATKELLGDALALPVLDLAHLAAQDGAPAPPRQRAEDDAAVLLYTSGSTGEPKGIVLSHRNLWAQASAGAAQWRLGADSRVLSWMPLQHNFGLHLGILAPLSQGASSVLMAPARFVESPAAWFRAIDQYRATHTGAPNFALDVCHARIRAEEVEGVLLDSLQALVCGGEPVRKDTCDRFAERFGALGFDAAVLCPHYGMSEAGAVSTRGAGRAGARFLALDLAAVQRREVRPAADGGAVRFAASCGEPGATGAQVCIVDPDTLTPCAGGRIGEVWIRSAGVATGYLRRDADTAQTFGVVPAGGGQGFLRSGDLGFVEGRQLYVVGRIKELMIMRGKNHYPADIEASASAAVPELALPVAAFSVEVDEQERLVIVQEVGEALGVAEFEALCRRIVAALSEAHGVEVHEVCLVAVGEIAATASGKLQRGQCRQAYLEQALRVRHRHCARRRAQPAPAAEAAAPRSAPADVPAALRDQVLLACLDIDGDKLDQVGALAELGLNSIEYIQIARQIEIVFGIRFEPTLLFKYRRFDELARYLQARLAGGAAPADADAAPAGRTRRAAGPSEVAVIGMSCHFPGGASDPQRFWDNLLQGRDGIAPLPAERAAWFAQADGAADWHASGAFPQWGGFIDGVDTFDADFFGIAPLEAECLDPQQRKLLELSWSVFEHAGYNPRHFKGRDVGLFVGAHSVDYLDLASNRAALRDLYGAYLDSGMHMSLIANRVSRWFDFNGPSQVVNTACSSSLVALHHAVESLERGDCSVAVAAGINLILSPRIYCASHSAGMLAPDGRCKSFDARANGFVRAEGYGAVLLKPYQDALRDGDRIYGVVRAACVNHDGQSNSLRAPNLNAQRRLIRDAWRQAGVAPRSVGYIEAHGTGTPLGDPIEVQALREAFQQLEADPGAPAAAASCVIGTAKTNIGHCESAAGMAGMIKVLLAMQHGVLPGMLHFTERNPFIDLDGSPFRLGGQTQPWIPVTLDGVALPRLAGVSSFGFGGVNAHVVLEEHLPPAPAAQQGAQGPFAVPLSARDDDALRRQARQLLEALDGGREGGAGLADIAYTLQVGRAAMARRLAVLAVSIDGLRAQLRGWLAGAAVAGVYAQGAAPPPDAAAQRLMAAWLDGADVDWASLHGTPAPRRVALPTYPFAPDRYWIEAARPPAAAPADGAAWLHPLLQRNTSDLGQQRFSSVFSGDEFFLADHVVGGKRVLPGVAQLEMACAAALLASGADAADGVRLADVAWLRPVVVGDTPLEVQVLLARRGDGAIDFRICSLDPQGREVLHSQGAARLGQCAVPAPLDLDDWRRRCGAAQWSAEQCYAAYAGMGIEYGPALRAVRAIDCGDGQALAGLELPACVGGSGRYRLHPSLLDAALHASLGLMRGVPAGSAPALPFALDSLEIVAPCDALMWSALRHAGGAGAGKFDVDLCDAQGRVAVRLRGLAMRAASAAAPAAVHDGRQALYPVWDAVGASATLPSAPQRVLLVNAEPGELETLRLRHRHAQAWTAAAGAGALSPQLAQLAQLGEFEHIVWRVPAQRPCGPHDEELIAAQQEGVVGGFHLIKALLELGYGARALEWTVLTTQTQALHAGEELRPAHASVHGLVGSMAKEYPNWAVRLVDLPADGAPALAQMMDWPCDPDGDALVWRGGLCYRQRLLPGDMPAAGPSRYRQGGVYVVIGGAGGIGAAWSEHMIRTHAAAIVWIGRRPLDAQIQGKIEALAAFGPAPEYIAADAADADALEGAYQRIRQRHGRVHGVVNAAIVLADKSLGNMDEARFRAGLAAKVDVSVRLAQVFGREELDFMLFFSSLQSFSKAAGQSNYAAGCTFKDAFGLQLGRSQAYPVRVINWGYWGSVGVVAAPAYRERMAQMGFASIEAQDGMLALDALLQGSPPQMAFVKTAAAAPAPAEMVSVYPPASALAAGAEPALLDQVHAMLARLTAELRERAEFSGVNDEAGLAPALLDALSARLLQDYALDLDPAVMARLLAPDDAVSHSHPT
ncbi:MULTISPECIES: SDR family NAD(P)-dependent oxidoreductase [unclassified Janthinobacterium]|uniref:SDR family NAD(P)-dependent oxidoreductase n=1 Tax=unclassified Janthinobacterium TaxID=2610881 RepID=UPI0003462233|nr:MULTISPECIES: SDR family NAD(P)-dependent oxidoreductase [unclassified Janthinobacterium]MEC5160165.1 acyl transferase domain-containing protein/acyl-CoA synthetase (AMP-forming)/AMP-acid ligase II/acyl carrier protein [Janthinobacterium sp. CG_S6]